jgi:phage gp46-like protein
MATLDLDTRDYLPDSLDDPVSSSLIQAVLLRLRAHRGAFWFDPTLGSHLHLLRRSKDLPRLKKLAEQYTTEALEPLVTDGRITHLTVAATQPHVSQLALKIAITQPNGTSLQLTHIVQVGG